MMRLLLTPARPLHSQTARSRTPTLRLYSTVDNLSNPPVLLEISGRKATITLNRPATGNTLDGEVQLLLTKHLNDIRANHDVRAVVLTSTGKYFCTGMNVGGKGEIARAHQGQGSSSDNENQFERASKMFRALEEYPKPIIALVQGSCYGGGCGLAMACDIRVVASEDVTFSLSEVRIGFIPAVISTVIVREWGVPLSREAMITARAVSAAELCAIRAVHYILSTLGSAAAKVDHIVAQIALGAPDAQGDVKTLVASAASSSAESHLATVKRFFNGMLAPCVEGKYGLECFQAKKKPDWNSLRVGK